MRLERLEIHGFKSFSDRSELSFDKGVTAIVGPNGCGKSNVADAITWVMGEQSAKSLRGERMEDVIFGGSDARKPTSAAEVRLRFSGVLTTVTAPALLNGQAVPGATNGHAPVNGHGGHGGHGPHAAANGNGHVHPPESGDDVVRPLVDAEEIIQSVARDVEVTRRLYRSGESEYLIDGQTCRLRDVHELLMDTGLGAKAYAIIEQGKIGLILSSRPTDRRQLVEEAAGVTKYKARRRSAELKLEAAQQNLARIDDIVFEVGKQRATLKRQAAKARRYRKLRDELRRCEKVLYARKYRELAETIESVRTRLAGARTREAAAAARVAEADSDLARIRVELVEAESAATTAREAAHACEMAISRGQQQLAIDREQQRGLAEREAVVQGEMASLAERREPARVNLGARREAAAAAGAERDLAARALAADAGAYEAARREIEGLEADVEAARSEVFSAINSATALRHSLGHAASQRDRVAETLSSLRVEADEARTQLERASADRAAASDALRRVQEGLETTRVARAARDSELASARIEHEWRARGVRAGEHKLAGLEARLASLEELEAARADYGDAARTILAQANGAVGQRGAIADYLEVEAGYERAVEACLADLLQHVIVDRHDHAVAGLRLVRDQRAGRCGFLIAGGPGGATSEAPTPAREVLEPPEGLVRMSTVVRVGGPHALAIREAIGDAWIAASYEQAAEASRTALVPVVATTGEVFRGPRLVMGGSPDDQRGILETRRAIKDVRDSIDAERESLVRLSGEAAVLEGTIAGASQAIAALGAEQHRQEKTVVSCEGHLHRAEEEVTRLQHRTEQLDRERRQAEEERDALDRRQDEARTSIVRLEDEQRAADARLAGTQRRLFEAREAAESLSRRAAEAGASHAALVERAAGFEAEVARLEDGFADLERRAGALAGEVAGMRERGAALQASAASGEMRLDTDVRSLDGLRLEVRTADDAVSDLRARADRLDGDLKSAREALESVRMFVASLDVERATTEGALAHLAQAAVDAVQATLDDIVAEVAALEAAGTLGPDARVVCAPDVEDVGDEGDEGADDVAVPESLAVAAEQALGAEEAITRLREKIERLGPVNMMAIEQFDELDARHTFLDTQRRDLVDSIAQTSQAIRRIDETTRQRFSEALSAINRNFQETFSTLFGGGRAGLTLLDETDPLESGIEIIAQPPGKRLQSVQLLSGGEKALTAIALMFGLFKFKPSPFCLLDEIDAPLDDANIGRFVEMLRGMQRHTQFILITHNRKTMEIADRLYGVTMEEPGVSKLISVQLN